MIFICICMVYLIFSQLIRDFWHLFLELFSDMPYTTHGWWWYISADVLGISLVTFQFFTRFFFVFVFFAPCSLWARASFTMPYPMNWDWDVVFRFIFYPVFVSRLCGRVFHSLLESAEYINSCPHNMRFQSSKVGELISRVGSDESFVLCLCSI